MKKIFLGISLIHLLLLFEYNNYDNFLLMYSNTAREIFNFTHAFTFGSLVGNGIKFLSAYKRCKIKIIYYILDKLSAFQYFEAASITSMKKSMIFSGIILTCKIIITIVSVHFHICDRNISRIVYTSNILFEIYFASIDNEKSIRSIRCVIYSL